MRRDVVIFLVNENKVLLAMKKRGLGMGKFNGPGGKVEDGETFVQAVIRECQEEVGITPIEPEKMAELRFDVHHEGELLKLDVEVFVTSKWTGEPVETEEMAPQWFDVNKLPLNEMWADDIFWLPQILDGKKLRAAFVFDKNDQVIEKVVEEIDKF